MEICDLLSADRVISCIRATNKKQLIENVSMHAANICGKNERTIFDILLERERLGTTGIGRGIAIPHGKLMGSPSFAISFLHGTWQRACLSLDKLPTQYTRGSLQHHSCET